jgi:hypothetical protein
MATSDFFKADFASTLYPLRTNLLLVEHHEKEVSEYIYQKVLNEKIDTENFLPQQKVYATKPRGHLRRTVKLDPVAEYFIYDIIHRNRSLFRPEVSESRQSFGYRFKGGNHIPVHIAYNEYINSLGKNESLYKHKLQFDIASYFNGIYHHDITHWFASKDTVSDTDAAALGKYFREINAGRSVDFLPHGIYPCKMLGNEFLKFVDLSGFLKSKVIIRFMDDFTLFDDDASVLQNDFVRIQQLLGQFGLNINPSKTHHDKMIGDVQKTLSALHTSLVGIVSEIKAMPSASGIQFVEVETEVQENLDQDQVNALLALLKDETLEESDAELILGFLRAYSDSVLEYIPILLRRFPNLIKHIHTICGSITEKSELATIILSYLSEEKFFLEYQLFWLGCVVEEHLMGHGCYGEVLLRIYELSQDFKIARAKILEIPEQGFGLKEKRDEFLKTGQSDWLSWASAIGIRSVKPGERNYALDYFSKGSPLNYLVAGCVKKL